MLYIQTFQRLAKLAYQLGFFALCFVFVPALALAAPYGSGDYSVDNYQSTASPIQVTSTPTSSTSPRATTNPTSNAESTPAAGLSEEIVSTETSAPISETAAPTPRTVRSPYQTESSEVQETSANTKRNALLIAGALAVVAGIFLALRKKR